MYRPMNKKTKIKIKKALIRTRWFELDLREIGVLLLLLLLPYPSHNLDEDGFIYVYSSFDSIRPAAAAAAAADAINYLLINVLAHLLV